MRQIKNILVLVLTTLLINACDKEESQSNNEESQSNSEKSQSNSDCNFDSNITISGNVLTQNQQEDYFKIWKSIVMKKSNMTEAYFANHIKKYVITSSEWDAGISFRVDYIMHIDWIDIKCHDDFIVKMNSNYDAYQNLNIPRDIFFNQNQIESNISSNVNSISFYNLIENLKFKDCDELNKAIKKSSGYNEAKTDYATYYVPGNVPRENGDPYVIIKGTINDKDNECITGEINLNTGTCNVRKSACRVF